MITRAASQTRDFTGWQLKAGYILPTSAYITKAEWWHDFEKVFPDKVRRMRDLSEKRGWNWQHIRCTWAFEVVIKWLDEQLIKDQL